MKSNEDVEAKGSSSETEFYLRDYSEVLAIIRSLNTLKWTIFSLSFVVTGLLWNLLWQCWRDEVFEVWEKSLICILICIGGTLTILFFLIILSRIDVHLDWRYNQMHAFSSRFKSTLGVSTFWAKGPPKPVDTDKVKTGLIPRFFGKKKAGKMVTGVVLVLLVTWLLLLIPFLLAFFGDFCA